MKKPDVIKVMSKCKNGVGNTLHNKNLKRALCLGAALTIFVSGVNVQEVRAEAEKEYVEAEEDVLTNVVTGQTGTSSPSADKEETVYLMTDAYGNVEKTIVSEWLKNKSGEKEITDASNLKDIVNVKGDETFKEDKDGNITWDANGSDIYYQGSTNEKAPVDVKIQYFLDDKEIAPEELAGKSGKVKIRLDYENNATKEATIHGKTEQIHVPFTVVSALLLDSEVFSNVEVTNGKIVSDGNRNIVVGVAMPGLKDSIDPKGELDDKIEDLNIPDYVEITADAKEFKLDMTVSVAMADILSDFNFTDSIDLSDIEDSMAKLDDASNQLVDGSGKLEDGTFTLKDGANKLKSGMSDLSAGISQYTDGVAQLSGGMGQLKSGSSTLASGAGQVSAGVDQAVNSLAGMSKQLQSEAKTQAANQAAMQSKVAVDQGAVKTAVTDYATNVAGAAAGAAVNVVTQNLASLAGAGTALTTNLSDAGAQAQAAGAHAQAVAEHAKVAGDHVGAAGTAAATAAAILSSIDSNDPVAVAQGIANAQAQLASVVSKSQAAGGELGAIGSELGGVSGNLSAIGNDLTAVQGVAGSLSIDQNAIGATVAAAVPGAVAQVPSQGVTDAVTTLANDAGSLGGATGALTVLQTINGQMDLSSLSKLQAGAKAVADGALTLDQGVATARNGVATLNANSGKLKDGSSQLVAGTATLADGAGTLSDGAVTLHDGMLQFDEEGIKELTSVLDGDASSVLDRIHAVMDAGNEYQSFTKVADGKDGKVKFIIRTGSVK